MKFSNFLFPGSRDPVDDHRIIDETLREAQLCDRLGMECIWLAEHHFDGICAYVDPVSFAAAIVASTEQIKVGFAVAQMSLHHPIRFAEQMSLIDNISRGRLIVGLGRGTAYNIYDYQGYGIDPSEAQERLIESEQLMLSAWTGERIDHHGKYWDISLPMLRPRPFTQPHPYVIRACSGESSMLEMAREGRPFLMNVQTNEVTRQRMERYRQTMHENGFDEEHIARNTQQTWAWRNVLVTETDAEAQRIAGPAFTDMIAFRTEMRERIYREQGVRMKDETSAKPARAQLESAVLAGSPDTVAAGIEAVDATGVGGLILQFRLGPMSYEQTETSIELFMREVAPRFHPGA